MANDLLSIIALLSALGCGVVAGVFFAFSVFVMRALTRLPPAQGIAAMQSINSAVITPAFMGVFLGTVVTCAAAATLSLPRWRDPGARWLLAGGVLYMFGAFLVTMVFNVPKNEALGALDPNSAGAADAWSLYVSSWTAYNHVRLAAALAATAAFIVGLSEHLRRHP